MILFHGDERVAFHRVCRAVGERDARNTLGPGLNQIAFIQRELIIGVGPLHGVCLFYLHFAVEVDEARLARGRS